MQTAALVNQKGGVGKTTTTVNLGAALAARGQRVLAIDFDPQGHLTTSVGLPHTTPPATLAEALLGRFSGDLRDLLTPFRERMDVITTNLDAFLLEGQLYPAQMREYRLDRLLEVFSDSYDVCLIDCPPSLGPITDNALTAARRHGAHHGGVIVPVESEDSSIEALDLLLQQQIQPLAGHLGDPIEILGLVVNGYDARKGQIVTTALDALRQLPTLEVIAVIRDRSTMREAWRARQAVVDYDPGSEAADWYHGLAETIAKPLGLTLTERVAS